MVSSISIVACWNTIPKLFKAETVRSEISFPFILHRPLSGVINPAIIENRVDYPIKLDLENKKLHKYLIEKASISINGISLTISKITKNYFEINVIPHTLKLTNLKALKKNDFVNVELDIFSKYMLKLSN